MNYAVARIGGKQYKIFPNSVIAVDKIAGEKGGKIKIEDVLLLVEDNEIFVGRPRVDQVSINATVVEQLKDKKQRVVKFKPKSRYLKVQGSRRFLTKLEIASFEKKRKK